MVVYNNVLAGAAGQAGGADAAGPIKSVRFNSGDSARLTRTAGTPSSSGTWTASVWVKRSKLGSESAILGGREGSDATQIYFKTDNTLRWYEAGADMSTDHVFRDVSAWSHFVFAKNGTTSCKIYHNGVEIKENTTSVPSTSKFNTSGAELFIGAIGLLPSGITYHGDHYLADFYFIDGSALDPTSFGAFDDNGVWQAAAYSGTFGTNGYHLFDFANESGVGSDSSGNDNDFTVNNITGDANTTGVSRVWSSGDSGWSITGSGQYASKSSTSSYADVFTNLLSPGTLYGFTVDIPDGDDNGGWFLGDSNSTSLSGTHPNQGRGSNSIGQRGRSASPANDSLGVHGTFATANSVTAGDSALTGFQSINPYGATEIDFVVDRVNHKCWVKLGSNSSWIKGGDPANPSSTPSFHLPSTGDMYFGFIQYDDQTNLEITQFNVTQTPSNPDVLYDVPTNGSSDDDTGAGGELSSNYCTWNPLDKATVTLANGNLDITAASTDHCVRGTIAVPESVKIYYEFTVTQRGGGGAQSPIVGVANTSFDLYTNPDAQTSTVWAYSGGGSKLGGGSSYTSYGSSLSANDVLGVAIDRSAGRIWFSLNGTWQNSGDPTDSTDSNAAFTNVPTTGTLFIFFGNNNGTPGLGTLNAGQSAFAYSAPTDYKTLCTTNLPTPTIGDGSDYFDTQLWTGTASTRSITGYGFSPDLVWIKNRTDSAHHHLYDTVRGEEKRLRSNDTDAEDDFGSSNSGQSLTSFNSDGFTIGDFNGINGSGDAIVAWAWDAGSSTVSNTDGSITASVRANQTAGFSIVSYTGTGSDATVGHGLNAQPYMVILKDRSASNAWAVQHVGTTLGSGLLKLNSTDAVSTGVADPVWNSTAPTSSVFSVGTSSDTNGNDNDYIAYCFAPVEGYSAFGSYTGNGSSNGPFVYTGHLPRFVIIKRTDTSGNDWQLYDTARSTFNEMDDKLKANSSAAEVVEHPIDFLSNGFKPRNTANGSNGSGATYIYASFASNPFKASSAR